jgi:hypothetical protein
MVIFMGSPELSSLSVLGPYQINKHILLPPVTINLDPKETQEPAIIM